MIPISKLKLNPTNPRIIKDDKFKKLVQSLKDFPEMMEKRPMVCVTDEDGKLYPLGGNMRLRAIKEMGFKEVPETWVALADEWTEEQRREFIIKDNANLGDWNLDDLQENWDLDLISEWGVDLEWDEDNTEIDETDLSDDLDVAFKVEVECDNESEQEKLYNELIDRGLKCRLLTL
jgi:ParB-like chromosome segregation protein Spo0J